MPVETITREGDYIIRNARNSDLLRIHADEDTFTISMSATTSLTMGADEMEEIRDWITRRLTESL